MKTMKLVQAFSMVFLAISFTACAQKQQNSSSQKLIPQSGWNQLTPAEARVIVDKGTEYPGTGKYLHNKKKGTYTCKRCNAPLYRSEAKFESECGWPSFDDEIRGAVK